MPTPIGVNHERHCADPHPDPRRHDRWFSQDTGRPERTPLHVLSPTAARAVLAGVQTGALPWFEVDSENCTISGGPTGEIALHIVRPRGSPVRFPWRSISMVAAG